MANLTPGNNFFMAEAIIWEVLWFKVSSAFWASDISS